MDAITRNRPPHLGHNSISILNTEEQVVAFADLLVVHSISPLRTRLASVM